MPLVDWLLEPAEVSRTINGAYMVVVTAISLSVLLLAWWTRDRNALRLYVLSIPIWLCIEGFGLATGMREYTHQWPLVYVVVAVMEDPGWVTLAYMIAWRLLERRFPGLAVLRGSAAEVGGGVSPPPSSSS
jgi:hypothetical protein